MPLQVAGLIGNLLQKRAENPKVQAEKEPHAPPSHLCLRDIPPFASFPPKSRHYYTGTKSQGQGEDGAPLEVTTGSQITETQDQSFEYSTGSADWSQYTDQGKTGDGKGSYRFDGEDVKEYLEEGDDAKKKDEKDAKNETTYGILYAGLSLISLGIIFCFTGQGELGFKTWQLLIVGPILILIGFFLVIGKVILCHCPKTVFPDFCSNVKSMKNSQVGQQSSEIVNDMGTANNVSPGPHLNHTGDFRNVMSRPPQLVSQRVTFLSASDAMTGKKKTAVSKLRNTIPNYIENSSDEEFVSHVDKLYGLNVSGNTNEIPLNPKALSHQIHNHSNFHNYSSYHNAF